MKKIITQSEKIQLLGLLTLARQHWKIVNQCNSAMCGIIGSDDFNDAGLLSDAVYDDTDIDSILRNMEIEVK